MNMNPIYVALLSLAVSLITLYLVHLRPAKLSVIVGSTVGVNHQGNGFSLYLPINFINSSQCGGTIYKCGIVLSRPEQTQSSHYIEWTEFRKHSEETKLYIRDEFAGPLYIEGRSSVSKLAWFLWEDGGIDFKAGQYTLNVYIWEKGIGKPSIKCNHQFYIDNPTSEDLSKLKSDQKTRICWQGIDKQIESNKMLTAHEIKALLAS